MELLVVECTPSVQASAGIVADNAVDDVDIVPELGDSSTRSSTIPAARSLSLLSMHHQHPLPSAPSLHQEDEIYLQKLGLLMEK